MSHSGVSGVFFAQKIVRRRYCCLILNQMKNDVSKIQCQTVETIIIKCHQVLNFYEIRYDFCNNVSYETVYASSKYCARGTVIAVL
jgi:hypothetical protein